MKLSKLLNELTDVREEWNSYLARCPAHADGNPSLLITLTDQNTLLLHCRAGCGKNRVLESLQLKMSDLFDVEGDIEGLVTATSGPPAPPSPAHIESISEYLGTANDNFRDSPAANYALNRFGLDPELAYAIGLGYDDGSLPCEWLTTAYR